MTNSSYSCQQTCFCLNINMFICKSKLITEPTTFTVSITSVMLQSGSQLQATCSGVSPKLNTAETNYLFSGRDALDCWVAAELWSPAVVVLEWVGRCQVRGGPVREASKGLKRKISSLEFVAGNSKQRSEVVAGPCVKQRGLFHWGMRERGRRGSFEINN